MTTETILKWSVVLILIFILFKDDFQKKNDDRNQIPTSQLENNLLGIGSKLNDYTQKSKSKISSTKKQSTLESKRKMPRPILNGGNNHRSGQISLEEMAKYLIRNKVKRVIRLNGFDDKDNGGISMDDEKAICENSNIQFYHINFYSRNSMERIHELLKMGNTYLHCKHGFDRTGGAVAYHLRHQGYKPHEIVTHNGWEDYRETKGEKYLTDYFSKIYE